MKVNDLVCNAAGESHWQTTEITLSERSFAPPAEAEPRLSVVNCLGLPTSM